MIVFCDPPQNATRKPQSGFSECHIFWSDISSYFYQRPKRSRRLACSCPCLRQHLGSRLDPNTFCKFIPARKPVLMSHPKILHDTANRMHFDGTKIWPNAPCLVCSRNGKNEKPESLCCESVKYTRRSKQSSCFTIFVITAFRRVITKCRKNGLSLIYREKTVP